MKIAIHRQSTKGGSRLVILIFVLLLLMGWVLGSQVVRFYYSYYDIMGLMEAQAKKATLFNDAKIKETLVLQIKSLEIPIERPEEALIIERSSDNIVIRMKYDEVLYLDLGDDWIYDLWIFKFEPKVEQPL